MAAVAILNTTLGLLKSEKCPVSVLTLESQIQSYEPVWTVQRVSDDKSLAILCMQKETPLTPHKLNLQLSPRSAPTPTVSTV